MSVAEILDGPPTGQGLGMLRTPQTFADVARVGPVRKKALMIDGFLRDPAQTGVVAVALPEEMPVNETIELAQRLRDEMRMGLDGVVVNGLYPDRFTGDEVERMRSVDGTAVQAALSEHRRARAQRAELRRLKKAVEAPVVTLPFLFQGDLGREAIDSLSEELEL